VQEIGGFEIIERAHKKKMIGWEDVYKVIVAVVPLYFALFLGYGSVRWWNIFTREQCDAINKLVCYFTLPLFAFEFTAHIDPFKMNFLFIGADTLSKLIIVAVIALWAKCSSKGNYQWSITSFSLCTLTNSLVVGIPMVKPMYGAMGVDLVVQASVVQAIIWLTLLLFVLEFRRTGIEGTITTLKPKASSVSNVMINEGEDQSKDVEANNIVEYTSTRLPFIELMKRVWLKFIVNPNSYGCVIGISWAFISNRYTIIFLNFFFELILFYYICLHLASLINFFAPDFLFTLPLV
jgi:auxin efflux carrier family